MDRGGIGNKEKENMKTLEQFRLEVAGAQKAYKQGMQKDRIIDEAQVQKKKSLSVPDQHRKKIALQTLKMSDSGARIMGGMSKDEARSYLKSIGHQGKIDEDSKDLLPANELGTSKKSDPKKRKDLPSVGLKGGSRRLTFKKRKDLDAVDIKEMTKVVPSKPGKQSDYIPPEKLSKVKKPEEEQITERRMHDDDDEHDHKKKDKERSKDRRGERSRKYAARDDFDYHGAPLSEGMSHEARELTLYADNDGDLYRQNRHPLLKNLAKKQAKGVYNPDLATKLWKHHATLAAQKYAKEHGDGRAWHHMFNTAHRHEAAVHWEKTHRDELKDHLKEEVTVRGQTFNKKTGEWDVKEKTYKVKGKNLSRALKFGLKKVQKEFPGHKEYEANIKEEILQELSSKMLANYVTKSRSHSKAMSDAALSNMARDGVKKASKTNQRIYDNRKIGETRAKAKIVSRAFASK